MDYFEIANKHEKYRNPIFIQLLNTFGYGRLFVKAQGSWVWDSDGNRYLDFISGYGSMNLGHNHPRIHQKIREVLEQSPYQFLHFGPCAAGATLCEGLAKQVGDPFQVSLLSTSGSEAVESALKLACIATGKSQFIYASHSFHGTGMGSLSVMGEHRFRKPFDNLLIKNREIPFGNLPILQEALKTKKFAALLLEPIQCEGGLVIPAAHYLDQAAKLCKESGTLFILDEVQTGFGRTGQWFAFQDMKERPDILVFAKALSGGILPIAATMTRMDLFRRAYGTMDTYDLHGSTFGGSALACEVASETLRIIEAENLVENAANMGAWLLDELRKALVNHPLVSDVRGKGLLIAIEMGAGAQGILNRLTPFVVDFASKKALGQWISYRLLQKGILLQPATHAWNVLKLTPPLSLQMSEAKLFIQAIVEVFAEASSFLKTTTDLTLHLGKLQFANKDSRHEQTK